MDKTFLSMSNQELDRYDIINRLIRQDINGTDAARMLSLSKRQVRRLKGAVKKYGAEALIHGNRGRKSNRSLPDKEKETIIKLLHQNYHDFWPTHASEKLSEAHNIVRDPKTIRQIMIDEKLWKPKQGKKKQKHREWRQRKANYGEMIQFDGSYEYWFEDRVNEKQCLLLAVDDATGKITHAKFDEHEGVFPVFSFWQEYVEMEGKPMSIYMDKFSTYSMNHKLAKENPDTLTQFQRALEELRIEPISANSPEAKGRVERMFKTLQNRFIKEMRLRNISRIEEANQYLKEEFIPWYNNRYAHKARAKTNYHKKLTIKEKKQLLSIFSRQKEKTVQNDFTVVHDKQWYQLNKQQPVTIQKRDKVIIEEHLDNSIKIRLRGRYLNYISIEKGQKRVRRTIPWVMPANYVIQEPIHHLTKVGHF